jgi:hypothetical protein
LKAIRFLAFAWVIAVAGCSKPEPVVVLDGRWSADVAQGACTEASTWYLRNAALISRYGCERIISCRALLAVANACARDPVQQVREFEAELAAAFAGNAECNAVRFVSSATPPEGSKAASLPAGRPYWSLGLDFSPGATKQQWSMVQSADQTAFVSGEGDPGEIAGRVCAIVRREDAALRH